MFNSDEIIQRNRNIENLISFSNILLLSSKSALSDFQNFYQENNRVRVLQFVSQPGPFQEYDESRLNVIKLKYNIEGDYFIVPNQLWKHKNHIVIINALNYLKQKGLNIKVVFTGLLNDYRDKTHAEFIKNVIKNYNVDILLLGLINYEDVISLIKGSIAVINPSLFEGWSTTVEECKSLGKNIILSNIPVHKEQAPEYAIYFNPEDYLELANIIQYHFINNKSISHLYNISEYDQKLKERTTNFYNNYLKIVKELL
jgi:glycosyltransferase involved in cell wall biosynthesis